MSRLQIFCLGAAAASVTISGIQAISIPPPPIEAFMPHCQEDEALVGSGDFENGQWTSYVCGGAVDDYDWTSATIDTNHPFHNRAQKWICEHPRHAWRGHGLEAIPEACHDDA
jgi:hypothetical protein